MGLKKTWSVFVRQSAKERKWNQRAFAQKAGVSARAIQEAVSGLAEEMLKGDEISHHKRLGLVASTVRIMKALDADRNYWMKHLNLFDEKNNPVNTSGTSRSMQKYYNLMEATLTHRDVCNLHTLVTERSAIRDELTIAELLDFLLTLKTESCL